MYLFMYILPHYASFVYPFLVANAHLQFRPEAERKAVNWKVMVGIIS